MSVFISQPLYVSYSSSQYGTGDITRHPLLKITYI
jgi:hypothetical protein